jgi:hypothetical protein
MKLDRKQKAAWKRAYRTGLQVASSASATLLTRLAANNKLIGEDVKLALIISALTMLTSYAHNVLAPTQIETD